MRIAGRAQSWPNQDRAVEDNKLLCAQACEILMALRGIERRELAFLLLNTASYYRYALPVLGYRKLIVSVLALGCSSTTGLAQPQLGVLCAKGNTIVVRPYCLLGEEEVSVSTLTKTGPVGDTGGAGSKGAKGRFASFTSHGSLSVPQEGRILSQTCPAGQIAVGGGCSSSNPTVAIARSYPSDTAPNQWICQFKPRAGTGFPQASFITFAMCIDS